MHQFSNNLQTFSKHLHTSCNNLQTFSNNFLPTIFQQQQFSTPSTFQHLGYLDVLRLLLEAGFFPNGQDGDGWTPLHAAAHWEQLEACRYLAAFGANFNVRNKLGQRPIDVADDALIPEFTKLQKSRPKKENLPSLPDLPPPSPTKYLPEPPHDPPQVVSLFLGKIFEQILPIFYAKFWRKSEKYGYKLA